jgi:hypothetical protein
MAVLFDFQNFGAKLPEQGGAIGSRKNAGKIENANAGERPARNVGHRESSLSDRR